MAATFLITVRPSHLLLIFIAMSALNSFADRSVESLACFLRLKGFQEEIVDCLRENKVDGATFLKFTRDDLKDIFPTSFQFRKKIWDYLEDTRNERIIFEDVNSTSTEHNEHCTIPPASFEGEPESMSLKPTASSTPSHTRSSSACSSSSSGRSSSSRRPFLSSSKSERSTLSSSTSGRSSPCPSTENMIDIEEDFRFHVPQELRKCNLDLP